MKEAAWTNEQKNVDENQYRRWEVNTAGKPSQGLRSSWCHGGSIYNQYCLYWKRITTKKRVARPNVPMPWAACIFLLTSENIWANWPHCYSTAGTYWPNCYSTISTCWPHCYSTVSTYCPHCYSTVTTCMSNFGLFQFLASFSLMWKGWIERGQNFVATTHNNT